jgi:hypothetical protein
VWYPGKILNLALGKHNEKVEEVQKKLEEMKVEEDKKAKDLQTAEEDREQAVKTLNVLAASSSPPLCLDPLPIPPAASTLSFSLSLSIYLSITHLIYPCPSITHSLYSLLPSPSPDFSSRLFFADSGFHQDL